MTDEFLVFIDVPRKCKWNTKLMQLSMREEGVDGLAESVSVVRRNGQNLGVVLNDNVLRRLGVDVEGVEACVTLQVDHGVLAVFSVQTSLVQ